MHLTHYWFIRATGPDRGRHILAVTIASRSLPFSSIGVPDLPFCSLRAFPLPFPAVVDPQASPRCRDYYCSFFVSSFATTRSSDVNAATDRPRRPRREVLGSQSGPLACPAHSKDILLPKRTTADKRSPSWMTNERVPPHNCGSSRTAQIKHGHSSR